MSGPVPSGSSPRRLRPPGRLGQWLKVAAVVTAVVVAGVGLAAYLGSGLGEPTLTIYTYSSLFGGPGTAAYAYVFDTFASVHHVHLDVEFPSGTLVSTLLAQANAPAADLVIGLDEITAPQAESRGLLVPYTPPELANVSPGLVDEISPGHGVSPYEWGYLAIDYNSSFANRTEGAVAHATLPEFAENSSWARQLLIEDPTVDITGEEFLVWEIEYYEHVLGENWTDFWSGVLPHLRPPATDWGTAFGEFTTPSGDQPQMVVSYSTDPAYAAYYGQGGQYNSTVSWWNGTAYGWRTLYGVGIVAGTRHLGLDEEFVDWLMSGNVQNEIPLNEWEYPANETVHVPAVYSAALDPSGVVPLNDETSPDAVASSLYGWVSTYEQLANQLLPS
jgi:thiamine transport system substrate-binding protein